MERLISPYAIEAKSMEIIDRLIGDFPLTGEKEIIKRIIHATGDPDFTKIIEIHPEAIQAAYRVFSKGKKIITDVKMVRAGIKAKTLEELGIEVYCCIDEPAVVKEASEKGLTRAMLAIRYLAGFITNNMVVIGNAPTALMELIGLVKANQVRPGMIVATPVGFVGAAEEKRALTQLDIPYITVHGTKGGSTIAVSIVNALLNLYPGSTP